MPGAAAQSAAPVSARSSQGVRPVSGHPNYSDEDEKDRCRDTGWRAGWGSTGQRADCCLRLAGKYRDPLSNFQAPPARPGRRLHRPDQGRRGLSWPGLDLFSRSCQRALSCCLHLPSCQRQEFHLSFPSLSFFYPSPLHSSKNFSIFDQSDIQNVAQRQCQGLGHAREYPMPPSARPPKKFPRSNSRGNHIASFATASTIDTVLDSTAN